MSKIMDEVHLLLPYPPSLNRLYRYGNGKYYMTQIGKDYKMLVKALCNQFRAPRFTLEQRLHMSAYVFPPDSRKRDIDNLCKVMLDAMQWANVYENDSQIKRLYLEMNNKVSKRDAHVDVRIGSIN
jgi:crossover junction endodeoxyribonuclease RusA